MFRQTAAETLGIKAYYIFNKQNTIKAYLDVRYVESTQAICYNHSNSNGVMDMELRVLKYFLMVAREENITKAAQLLHVTQPTLSRQLMQLEEELGVQLFHRGKHNVTLTEDGMLLRRRAQELVSLSEKTKMELQHKEEMLRKVAEKNEM